MCGLHAFTLNEMPESNERTVSQSFRVRRWLIGDNIVGIGFRDGVKPTMTLLCSPTALYVMISSLGRKE